MGATPGTPFPWMATLDLGRLLPQSCPMSGRWPTVLRGMVGTLGCCLVGLVSVLAPIEAPVPWATQPGRAQVQEALEIQRHVSRIAKGPLKAGWARERLIPASGDSAHEHPDWFRTLPLAGFGARRGKPATGTLQDLWTKALALQVGEQRVVLIASDLLIVPREVAEAVIGELGSSPGLRRDQVYFTATHTHGSLGGWGEGWVAEQFGGPFKPEVRTWMASRLTEVARRALASMAPASIGFDTFDAPEGIRNRLVGDAGAVDPEFAFLRVRREDGQEALWGSYGAHATVVGAGEMRFHGDYPGAWQESMESETGGLALFAAAAVGSQGPRAPGPGWDGARGLGRSLARKVLDRRLNCPMQSEVELGSAAVSLDLPPLRVRLGDRWQLRPWAAERVLPVSGRTTLQGVRIGPWTWLSTPCDFSGELAVELKAKARAAGMRCAVTSFNGDYLGYVLPTRYQSLDSYESRTMCFYGPILTDAFMETLGGLLDVLNPGTTGGR